MTENNKNLKNENDSLQDVAQIQCNDEEVHCTDEIQPIVTVSGNGNPIPMVVMSFLISAALFVFACLVFFSDMRVTFGTIPSSMITKAIASVTFLAISLFFLWFGIYFVKEARIYYQEKREFESKPIDETVEDEILQRICPKCGHSHDMDYPKCPNCKYNYFDI